MLIQEHNMRINFSTLSKIVFVELAKLLEEHKGLSVFASERSKFEGWLKVEICDILLNAGLKNIVPEKKRVDVICDGWAIELKTVNTNYRYANVINKTRPITNNVQKVIDDIHQLRSKTDLEKLQKAVLFIVFPVVHKRVEWQSHLNKIEERLGNNIAFHEFKFRNNVPGVIYFGWVC